MAIVTYVKAQIERQVVYEQTVFKTTNQSMSSETLVDDDELVIDIVMRAGDFVLGQIGLFGKSFPSSQNKKIALKEETDGGVGEISSIKRDTAGVLVHMQDTIEPTPDGMQFGSGSEHEFDTFDFWFSATNAGIHKLTVQWAKALDTSGSSFTVEPPSYISVTKPRGA